MRMPTDKFRTKLSPDQDKVEFLTEGLPKGGYSSNALVLSEKLFINSDEII